MKKAERPLVKYEVVIRIHCNTWWHIGHYLDKAFIIEAPEGVAGISAEAVSRTTGNTQPVKVIGVYPIMDGARVHKAS